MVSSRTTCQPAAVTRQRDRPIQVIVSNGRIYKNAMALPVAAGTIVPEAAAAPLNGSALCAASRAARWLAHTLEHPTHSYLPANPYPSSSFAAGWVRIRWYAHLVPLHAPTPVLLAQSLHSIARSLTPTQAPSSKQTSTFSCAHRGYAQVGALAGGTCGWSVRVAV